MSPYRINAKPEYCFQNDNRTLSKLFGLSGYSCTLLNKHKGEHIAEGDKTPVIYYWPGGRLEYLLDIWAPLIKTIFAGFFVIWFCYLLTKV